MSPVLEDMAAHPAYRTSLSLLVNLNVIIKSVRGPLIYVNQVLHAAAACSLCDQKAVYAASACSLCDKKAVYAASACSLSRCEFVMELKLF